VNRDADDFEQYVIDNVDQEKVKEMLEYEVFGGFNHTVNPSGSGVRKSGLPEQENTPLVLKTTNGTTHTINLKDGTNTVVPNKTTYDSSILIDSNGDTTIKSSPNTHFY
jgi:hypothetical protein